MASGIGRNRVKSGALRRKQEKFDEIARGSQVDLNRLLKILQLDLERIAKKLGRHGKN